MTLNISRNCIVVTCFSENQPGYLDFSYRIHALAKHYKLTIISQDSLTQPELVIADAKYQAMGRKNGKYGWLNYLYKCAVYARQHQPDLLVLLHSSASPIALLVGKIPTCLYWNEHPTNLVHLPAGFSPIRYLLALLSHWLVFLGARHTDVVMPIGEEHYADLLANGCEKTAVRLTYMGVSDGFSGCAVKKRTHSDCMQLIYIGTVSAPRGRDVMLEGVAEAIRRGFLVHLTIVGAGHDQVSYCNERLADLNIRDHVTLIGRVSGSEIPNLLSKADMGICLWEDKPWWRFNPPTKLFEYLVAGLPVIASDIRTHTRYVKNCENGLIFEYGAAGFAYAIGEVFLNPGRLSTMKINAFQSGQQYLWSRIEPTFMSHIAATVKI
ncbi:MAG: glycosyltransferase [Methylotenera sp.]|nr:glycosyltransferase [Methylotenera sp.]